MTARLAPGSRRRASAARASGRALRRGRAAGVERCRRGVRAGHDDGHPLGPGQVADDLDGQAGAARVEVDEVLAAHLAERGRQGGVARPGRRAGGTGDHAPVGAVAGVQRLGGKGGYRLRGADLAAGEHGGRRSEHDGTGRRGGGDAAEPHGSVLPSSWVLARKLRTSPVWSASRCWSPLPACPAGIGTVSRNAAASAPRRAVSCATPYSGTTPQMALQGHETTQRAPPYAGCMSPPRLSRVSGAGEPRPGSGRAASRP